MKHSLVQQAGTEASALLASGLLALGLVMGGVACSPSVQPTQPTAVATPPQVTPSSQPTETPSPTETPLPTATPRIDGNYHKNLVRVLEVEAGMAVLGGDRLTTDLLNRMIEDIAVITRRGPVDKEKVQIFLGENLQSSSLTISAKTERGEDTFDVSGMIIDVPDELTFVTNRGQEDEEVKNYSLLAERSSSGGAVYVDDQQRTRVLPLQFSLFGVSLANNQIAGIVPYNVKNEEGLRLSFITKDDQGRLGYLVGYPGRPFALREMRALLEGEKLGLDEEGRTAIISKEGMIIQVYNPVRGEWIAEWASAGEDLELAGHEVDFKVELEGTYRGIPYKFDLGLDFHNEAYDRIPVESIQMNNEHLMGQMIMWVHYRNWAMSKALESTGGVSYWRSQYRTGEGQWQRSSDRDMQRFIDAGKSAIEQYSFDDYVSMVQAGGGHYHIFGRNEQGAYDFHQVNPRQSMTYIYKENARTGIQESHPGHPMSHEVKVSDQGDLVLAFGIELILKTSIPVIEERLIGFFDNPEFRNKYEEQEIEEIRKNTFLNIPTIEFLSSMEKCYLPPTFTVQNLQGGPMGFYPEGRTFQNNFKRITDWQNDFSRALIPYYLKLHLDEDIKVEFPLEIKLAEGF